MTHSRDAIIEAISLALTQDLFQEIMIKTITLTQPNENTQIIFIENINNEKFKIEVTKL
jgi:hypothetical protein